jgi:hypothetical protein
MDNGKSSKFFLTIVNSYWNKEQEVRATQTTNKLSHKRFSAYSLRHNKCTEESLPSPCETVNLQIASDDGYFSLTI